MLTPRQKQILDFVANYTNKKGFAPSHKEIGQHFKLSSTATVNQHLRALTDKGYLNKRKHQKRNLEVAIYDNLIKIPLLGTIAAGEPIEAIEEKEVIAIPKNKLPSSGNIYALRVRGESMIDEKINNGDIVLIKEQNTARNGEKVVALINNREATLKTFYKEKNHIRLQPANKNFSPLILRNKQDFSIQGSVVDVIKNENYAKIPFYATPQKTEIKKYDSLPLNKIICGDAAVELKKIPDDSIDLVVTSPPYDDIRTYNGFTLNLSAIGGELFRVLKPGGIAAMVIQDSTKNFGKTLTSFRTVIDWCDNIGFKLFETVIYRKYGAEGAWWNKRFRVDHEYIPIFLKGERPQYFNKEPLKIPSKWGGKTLTGGGTRLTNGVRIATRPIKINTMKCRGTVWEYLTAGDGTRLKHQHPATFPDKLPFDFIQCFCPPGGVVLDPFIGSGTTALAALKLDKNYIGIDISKEYCELAAKRIGEEGQMNGRLL